MRNAPILGPYGDKVDNNKSIRRSFDSRDVMSLQLKRDYMDIEAVELSMEIVRKDERKEKEGKK